MEKHMISLPSSIYGRITFIAVSIDGAEVFGVVLFLSAHSYNAWMSICGPSSSSSSHFTIWSGIISISYLSKTSCDRSHVLSDIIFIIFNTSRLSKSFCPSFLFHYTILFYYFNCGINILFSCPYSIVTCSFYYSIKKRYFHQWGESNVHFTVDWLRWLCDIAL